MYKYLNIIIVGYFIIINFIGFISMFIDKRKAIKHQWRIKEATLFLFAFLGGGIGSTLGMHTFRHKTKHWYFVIGMPLIAIIETIILLYIAS